MNSVSAQWSNSKTCAGCVVCSSGSCPGHQSCSSFALCACDPWMPDGSQDIRFELGGAWDAEVIGVILTLGCARMREVL